MRTTTAVLAAALIFVSNPAFAQQQSLAELAAAEAKRREAQSKETGTAKDATKAAPKRVYTNKDLPASSSRPPVSPAGPTAAAVPDVSSARPEKGESHWRGRLAPYRARIVETAGKVIPMRRRILDLTIELSGIGPLNARRGGVETERQRLISEADALDVAIKMDRAALADIDEEGRRAGALPGWFR